jgi:hypothetical protein
VVVEVVPVVLVEMEHPVQLVGLVVQDQFQP